MQIFYDAIYFQIRIFPCYQVLNPKALASPSFRFPEVLKTERFSRIRQAAEDVLVLIDFID